MYRTIQILHIKYALSQQQCIDKSVPPGVSVGAFLDESYTSKIGHHYRPSNMRFFRLFAVFPNLLVRI